MSFVSPDYEYWDALIQQQHQQQLAAPGQQYIGNASANTANSLSNYLQFLNIAKNQTVTVAVTEPDEFSWLRKRVDDVCWKN